MKSLKESLLDDIDVVSDKLDTRSLIELWLKEWDPYHCCYINKDNTISGKGQFILRNYDKEELPEYIKFKYISGTFAISYGNLKSLKGCPKKVKQKFEINGLEGLKNLEGAPEITSIIYINKCDNLESLEGCPQDLGIFICNHCNKLKNLEGGPKHVRILYDCIDCEGLESLKGAPERVQTFHCEGCDNLNNLDYRPNCLRGTVPKKFK